MAQGTVKSRFQLKNDIEANWNKAVNFIPLKGEIIIYSIDESHPFSRLKVGDGVTNVINLPFVFANSTNDYQIVADTKSNWQSNSFYVPGKGDIVIWLDKVISNNKSIPGIKIGDGITHNIDLPFVGDDIVKIDSLAGAYGKCFSSPEEQEKTILLDNFELFVGVTIHVTFINANTAQNPVLKINNGTAVPFYNNKTLWADNETIALTYDGEYWRINGQAAVTTKLEHKLIFGSGQQFIFDGSKDIVVPVYTGVII